MLSRIVRSERGAKVLEIALVAALIGVATLVAVFTIGDA